MSVDSQESFFLGSFVFKCVLLIIPYRKTLWLILSLTVNLAVRVPGASRLALSHFQHMAFFKNFF